jgi:glycosyltransferase involved in cell wall biosynthesis
MGMVATVLIPAYNESAQIASVVQVALRAGFPVLVVDDGSEDNTALVATEAGAQVVSLQPNQGKSKALVHGLAQIQTPYLVLLDADLVGLQVHHLHDLLRPVQQDLLDMSIGIFKSGGLITDFGNRATPFLSGQRACKTAWFRGIPDLALQRWPEPAITAYLKTSKARWDYVDFSGASQVMKEQKRGLLKGFWMRLKMYADIFRR